MRVDQVTCYEVFSDDKTQCYGYVIHNQVRGQQPWTAFSTLPPDITQNQPLSFHRTANEAIKAIQQYEGKLERYQRGLYAGGSS